MKIKKMPGALAALTVVALAAGLAGNASAQARPVLGPVVEAAPAAAVNPAYLPPAIDPFGRPSKVYSEAHKKAHPDTRPEGVKGAGRKDVPPAPPAKGQKAMSTSQVYRYAGMSEWKSGTLGAQATFYMGKPFLDTRDAHSLSEIAVQQQSTPVATRDIVEIGMNVDRSVNGGSTDTHLFGYFWVDNAQQCYNGCGFVDYGPNTAFTLGTNVTALGWTNANASVARQLSVYYSNPGGTPGAGAWWLYAYNDWVGYYPETLWATASNPTQTFGNTDLVQMFGEVVVLDESTTNPDTSVDPKCSDMGTGAWAAHTTVQSPNAARIANAEYHYPGGGAGALPTMSTFQVNNRWTVQAMSAAPVRGVWFGGPGQRSNGAIVPNGVIGGC